MFKPIAIFIGLRYTRAKRHNHFISFIALLSMLGIALGVMVLITVLSVMNGFDHQIRATIFNTARQVTLAQEAGPLRKWQALSKKIQNQPNIEGVAPFLDAQAMLTHQGRVQGVQLSGILPEQQAQVSSLADKMLSGSLSSLQEGGFSIVLGSGVAASLGLSLGDKVTVVTPQTTLSVVGVLPRFKQFTVTGIFHIGGGFGFDSQLGLIHLKDAQRLFNFNESVSGLRLRVSDLYIAPQVAADLLALLGEKYAVSDWTEQYGEFFKTIRMEKTMMFFILLLIIAIAAFNLVSSLVMAVTDKRADIAILRTMGATQRMILSIFMVQGIIVGFLGTFLGVLGGIVLSLNVTKSVALIEGVFNHHFISDTFYYINYLPSELQYRDVWQIAVLTLFISVLATLYPAWQATRVQPAEALRYE